MIPDERGPDERGPDERGPDGSAPPPRVAYFPDSFHEVNGVAHTSRNFVAYAERHGLPMLCVRAGSSGAGLTHTGSASNGSVTTLDLPRSALSIGLEKDLAFDPLFARHAGRIEEALHRFQPDLLHLTGPSELGLFAAYFAWKLGLPLAASWHTNVHEYAAERLDWLTRRLPPALAAATARGVERTTLAASGGLYSLAQVLFAPNAELCDLLARATGRPCQLMQRGVDTTLFSPAHRAPRAPQPFVLGFVGRLSVEKNVALLPRLERQLAEMGLPVQFLIVGHGAEEAALRRDLPGARFAGVLRGQALAEAYAGMDLFVFPSHTDTFGNVVLEALASGVPAIVTPDGGPRSIVRTAVSGEPETGVVAPDAGFAEAIRSILEDPERHARMRLAARAYALGCTWDAVFDRVYAAYRPILRARGGSTTVSSPD